MANFQITSVPGAKLNIYAAGTTTPVAAYSDPGLTTTLSNPVVADSNGLFPEIWLPARFLKTVLTDADGAALPGGTEDMIVKPIGLAFEASAPAVAWPGLQYVNTGDGNLYQRNAANNAWNNLGPYDGAGNIASVATMLTGTDNTAYASALGVAAIWKKGADITLTNTTLSLPSTGGGYFNVLGSFNIAAINSATDGRAVWLYHSVARTLTRSSTFETLTGADMAVRVGDRTLHMRDGSAWIMLAHVRPNNDGLQSKSSNYTVTITENRGVIRFTAAATVSLPSAATAGANFRVTIVSAPGGGAVVIDPNSSETLDGKTTRTIYAGQSVEVMCDGSNWVTIAGGPYRFESSYAAIPATGGEIAVAHGLGKVPAPSSLAAVIKNVSGGSVANWAANDEFQLPAVFLDGGSANIPSGFWMWADATNVYFWRASTGGWLIPDKTTRGATAATDANWNVKLVCAEN